MNNKTRIDSDKVFRIARKHLSNNSSARACMSDAMAALNREEIDLAVRWSLRSLAHSVGILHPDYKIAYNASGVQGPCHLVAII